MAETVVAHPLLGIAEHLVSFGGFLEPFLGLLVAGVAVWVILHRQLAVSRFQILRGHGALNAENLVVVPLAHRGHVEPGSFSELGIPPSMTSESVRATEFRS